MSYLDWYLLAGVVVVSTIFVAHRMSKKETSIHDLLDAVNPDRDKLSYRILNHFVAPLLTTVAAIAFWPLTLGIKARDLLQKRTRTLADEQKDFAVRSEHLQECLSEEEIVQRELVADPLNAAPALPFGQLNAAWEAFRESRPNGSELWSFEAHWQPAWGPQEIRAGYVTVKRGIPERCMLTVLKRLEENVSG